MMFTVGDGVGIGVIMFLNLVIKMTSTYILVTFCVFVELIMDCFGVKSDFTNC